MGLYYGLRSRKYLHNIILYYCRYQTWSWDLLHRLYSIKISCRSIIFIQVVILSSFISLAVPRDDDTELPFKFVLSLQNLISNLSCKKASRRGWYLYSRKKSLAGAPSLLSYNYFMFREEALGKLSKLVECRENLLSSLIFPFLRPALCLVRMLQMQMATLTKSQSNKCILPCMHACFCELKR